MSITPCKLTSPFKYRHVALVEVDGSFPIDAFRYDRCHPFEEADSLRIEEANDLGRGRFHGYIFVVKYSESTKEPWFYPWWDGHSEVIITPVDEGQVADIRRRIAEDDIEGIRRNYTYLAQMRRRK